MKKLLSIFAVFGLTSIAPTSVIACDTKAKNNNNSNNDDNKPGDKLKLIEYFKGTDIGDVQINEEEYNEWVELDNIDPTIGQVSRQLLHQITGKARELIKDEYQAIDNTIGRGLKRMISDNKIKILTKESINATFEFLPETNTGDWKDIFNVGDKIIFTFNFIIK